MGRSDDAGKAEPAPEEEEAHELEVMPDLFVTVRRLLFAESGEPRAIVRVAPWVTLSGTLLFIPVILQGGVEAEGGLFPTELIMTRWAFMGLPFTGGAMYLPMLASAIRPGGPLEALGAGTVEVPTRSVRRLRMWRNASIAGGLYAFGFGTLFVAFYFELIVAFFHVPPADEMVPGWSDNGYEMPAREMMRITQKIFLPTSPMVVVSMLFGYPAAMFWYLSMKVAVLLAKRDVASVARDTNSEALRNDETFARRVAQPSIKLATVTMRNLSQGWGSGTAWTTLTFATICMLNFIGVVHGIRVGESSRDTFRQTVGCLLGAVAPFIIALDAAAVSSQCDNLLRSINNLRLDWATTESAKDVHARTHPLQCTLMELNHGQGLGTNQAHGLASTSHKLVAVPTSTLTGNGLCVRYDGKASACCRKWSTGRLST